MGDTKFTLIELHLDGDSQFGLGSLGTKLPFGMADDEESEETPEYDPETDLDAEDTDDDEDEDSSSKAIGAVLALILLVAAAAAAKKFRGGDDDEELEAEDEPDVIVN